MRYGLLAVGVAAAGTIASSAVAQSALTATDMLGGRAARSLDAHVTGDVEYDSNVAAANAELAALEGLKPADVIYSPTALLNFTMPVGRQAIFLQGSGSYLYHQNNRRLDHDRINLTGGIGNSLGPCGSVLTGTYATGRTEVLDQVLVTNVQNVLTTEGGGISLLCTRATGIGFIANGSYTHNSNTATQLTNTDIDTTSASAGLTYSRPAFGVVSLEGTYSHSSYPNRVGVVGESTGFDSTGAILSYRRKLGARIQLEATVGYTDVSAKVTPGETLAGVMINPQSDFQGPIFSGDVSFRASSHLEFKGIFSRQVTPSLLLGQSYEVQSNYSLEADYKIGSRITATLEAQLNESDAHGATLVDPSVAALYLTNSKLTILMASLRYEPSQRLFLLLHTQHEQRTADNARFEYEGYRVGLTAGVNF